MHYFSCLQDLVRTKRQESLPKDFAFLLYTFQNTRGNKFTRSFNVLTNVYFAAASMERPGLCLRVAWQVRLKLNQIQEKIEWKMKITRLKQKKIARQKKKIYPFFNRHSWGSVFICFSKHSQPRFKIIFQYHEPFPNPSILRSRLVTGPSRLSNHFQVFEFTTYHGSCGFV